MNLYRRHAGRIFLLNFVGLLSALLGAETVHRFVFKPDLNIPLVEIKDDDTEEKKGVP